MKTTASFVLLLLAPTLLFAGPVKLKKSNQQWTLLVDGQPYTIKGIGCNTATGPDGEDYLAMARELGANTVRTWGITPRSYFDAAQKNGLKVCAGVWFNPVRHGNERYKDAAYRKRLKDETLAHVRDMKGHPALLFWNLGNEVFTFSEFDDDRADFGAFLEDLIKAVHKEDPDHPVIYAAAGGGCLPYLKKYVPSLDVIGINTYGGFSYVFNWIDRNNYDKPVVATEFGPFGEWDRQKDVNGLPYDPADQFKANNYVDMWKDISRNAGRALGGFAFVLGDQRNQGSITWYNINYGVKKRQAYWELYQLYTGKPAANFPPKIKVLRVDKVKDLEPGSFINAATEAVDPENDGLTYTWKIALIADDPLIVAPVQFVNAEAQAPTAGQAKLRVPNDPGRYRVYVFIEDGKGNIATANRSITVVRR